METTLKNKYVIAGLKSIIFFAVVHFVSVLLYAMKTGGINSLNVFNILQFDLHLPGLSEGSDNFLYSYLFLIGVYLVMLTFRKR
ncbi:hypothetical protein A3F34_00400 [Candidatus Roizmanbacteria bacterium RIFCSPHIGHO2_12_FULL_44_10]|uniref:DUF5671 domain-containing protein n=1 Tax=Candidatus Roizmanbacteria bacterium RIFCSPHIGHO2_12_FULL_44_10 TaxID=1802054 RepID=A0A1F7I736_9BACT|nr:MAG: hypothetical protein A3F34_00400 [Candidatus Roizmanbacteria bacterium RIFCSPHIGHO2_12_FULL_44_10]